MESAPDNPSVQSANEPDDDYDEMETDDSIHSATVSSDELSDHYDEPHAINSEDEAGRYAPAGRGIINVVDSAEAAHVQPAGATASVNFVLAAANDGSNRHYSLRAEEDSDSSLKEFDLPNKGKPHMLPETSGSEQPSTSSQSDEDGLHCPICFEPWTNSGGHRLCALKCGHLFGHSCIIKWILESTPKSKCPQCNFKASKKDIRLLFAKSIKMLDTVERDEAIQSLEREKEARRHAEVDAAQTLIRFQLIKEENRQLLQQVAHQQQQIKMLKSNHNLDTEVPVGNMGKFTFHHAVKLSDYGGCRIMAYCPNMFTACVGQPSPNMLFPGFGIKKISGIDFRTTQYIGLHGKQIRDIAFDVNNPGGFVLTCAMDKTVKVTNLATNSIVQSYTAPVPLWSCTWHSDKRNVFFAGGGNGTIFEYDMRNTNEYVKAFNTEGSRSPVVSLEYLGANTDSKLNISGVVVGQLDQCMLFDNRQEEIKGHVLPFEGSMTNLCLHEESRHLLLTCRPTSHKPRVQHLMCQLCWSSEEQSVLTTQLVQSFIGGSTQKMLTRNRIIPHPTDPNGLLIAACDEASQSVHVWDAGTGELGQKINLHQTVMDVCDILTTSNYHLAALTEKQLLFYQYE